MISKELLSEVLDTHIGSIEYIDNTNTVRYTITTCFGYIDINIYELAHKCKRWACDKRGYGVSSYVAYDDARCEIFKHSDKTKTQIYGDTEPDAVFKACEWVLKETK